MSIKDYVRFYPDFFSEETANKLMEDLQNEIEESGGLTQKQIFAFGKTHDEPRLSQVFGTVEYTYSKTKHEPRSFTNSMIKLLDIFEKHFSVRYNTIVYNYYEDGTKYISEHSDNEPEIVQSAGIVSLSLGSTRTFRLRSAEESEDFELNNGSVIVMMPGCQEKYKHQVPKRLRVKDPRINLTFRYLKPKPTATTVAAETTAK